MASSQQTHQLANSILCAIAGRMKLASRCNRRRKDEARRGANDCRARHGARRGCQYRQRTRVRRVVVELASLHPLEAEGVPAQRRVRHELRLELADGDRHLPTAETAAIDQPRLRKALAAICSFQPGDGALELLVLV
jgi:hypothetical protein